MNNITLSNPGNGGKPRPRSNVSRATITSPLNSCRASGPAQWSSIAVETSVQSTVNTLIEGENHPHWPQSQTQAHDLAMDKSEVPTDTADPAETESKPRTFPHYDPETGAPICAPLKTLEEVWEWEPEKDGFCVATVPLAPRTHRSHDCPRTLVCHDMMGGYLDDRFVQGYHGNQCYRFYSWQYLDMFVYFSHHFVTIPPPWWTNTCHRHGVKVLGTFITEWDEGKLRCQHFLESEEKYKALAKKMVGMATYYNFEGWLVNIENKIEHKKVVNLEGFVRYLTQEMHAARPGSIVIWYDSVTTTGDLKWQDALNDLNRPYFDSSDGIFLNYGWKDKNLSSSAAIGSSCGRPLDIYVGVDVWGRGCFGGGGFNTNKAVAKAREHNLSVAIFAQGWVYETLEKKDFTENEDRFWSYLDELCPLHGCASLPFYSHFCQGWGHRYHQDGQVLSDKSWINLSLQSQQPTFPDTQFREQRAGGHHKQSLHWHLDDAFRGGSCVRLQAKAPSSGELLIYRLFSVDLAIEDNLLVSYTYKYVSGLQQPEVFLQLVIDTAGKEESLTLGSKALLSQDQATNLESQKTEMHKSPAGKEELAQWLPHGQTADTNGWMTRYYLLGGYKGSRLLAVNAGLRGEASSDPVIPDVQVLLGQVQIARKEDCLEMPLVSNLVIQDPEVHSKDHHTDVTLVLKWTFPANMADHFDVYYSGGSDGRDKLVGQACVNMYKVCKLQVAQGTSQLVFKVQQFTQAGFAFPLDKATSVTYNLPQ